MTLLRDLQGICEADSMDAIPEDAFAEVQKNIKAGAKDLEQKWANALELVHKAYDVSGVQRPTPDLTNAWKQYEINIQLAVEVLAKHRGIDSDWRMSAAMFHEALERKYKFNVVELGGDHGKSHTVEATTMQEVIDAIVKRTEGIHDVKVKKSKDKENPNGATISFSKWNIRKNYQLRITQVI